MYPYCIVALAGLVSSIFMLFYFRPKWFVRIFERIALRHFPLPVWYTDNKGKVIASSRSAQALLGDIHPETLYTITKPEDHHLAKYFSHMSIPGVERHVNLTLKNKEKLRIFQTSHGPYIMWVFHKKSEHTPNLYPQQQLMLLNRYSETIVQEAPGAVLLIDQNFRVLDSNKLFYKWFTSENELPGKSHNYKVRPTKIFHYFEGSSHDELESFLDELTHNRLKDREIKRYKLTLANATQTPVAVWGHLLPGRTEGKILYIMYCQDISWEKNLEMQFTHAQRMQALGQLSGSIAHDFNNILTGIIGFSDMLLSKFMPGQQTYSEVMQIKQNAYRGANLVRQLLAFSKQQEQEMTSVNASELITELMPLFERLLGPENAIKVYLGRDLDKIRTDPSQFEQIMMNLIVNARDALEGKKGEVTLRTNNLKLESPLWHRRDRIEPGEYVLIETIDSGCGIEKDKIDKIFDPFYTSKEAGRSVGSGAGLGLATVYSLVQQAKGYILVDSVVDEGTKFSILWPKYVPKSTSIPKTNDDVSQNNNVTIHSSDKGKDLQIYFVEDDEVIRMFSSRALLKKGYHIKAFSNATALLKDLEENPESKIDLLITDIVMPGMSGTELACTLTQRFSALRVIFISGYADTKLDELNLPQDRIDFLAKPYDFKTLLNAVYRNSEKITRDNPNRANQESLANFK